MPYQPTWNNPYLAQNSYQPVLPTQTYQPYQQQSAMAATQPVAAQQSMGAVKVDGPVEAMNRFLMRYPANVLVPGFISEPLFDVNGHQFHTLSVELDGRRNLETFDFQPHVEEQPVEIDGAQFVSREEFDKFTAKVNAALGVLNGVHETVPAAAAATSAATAAEPTGALADVQAAGTGRHAERG